MKIKRLAMPNGRQGFTLFELLVSISIIGIITAVAIVSYSGVQKKARYSRRVEDMQSIQKAAEQYYAQNGNYPTTTGAFTSGSNKVLQTWPNDPDSTKSYNYIYDGTNANWWYCACAVMDAGVYGNSDGNNCSWTTTGNQYCVSNMQ